MVFATFHGNPDLINRRIWNGVSAQWIIDEGIDGMPQALGQLCDLRAAAGSAQLELLLADKAATPRLVPAMASGLSAAATALGLSQVFLHMVDRDSDALLTCVPGNAEQVGRLPRYERVGGGLRDVLVFRVLV